MASNTISRNSLNSAIRPDIEHTFVKYPRRRAIDVTDYQRSTIKCARQDNGRFLGSLIRGKQYTFIHTHPIEDSAHAAAGSIPSAWDLKTLVSFDDIKAMIIVPTDQRSGDALGLFLIGKTRGTPRFNILTSDVVFNCAARAFFSGFMRFAFNRNRSQNYRRLVCDAAEILYQERRVTADCSDFDVAAAFIGIFDFLERYKLVCRYMPLRADGIGFSYAAMVREMRREALPK